MNSKNGVIYIKSIFLIFITCIYDESIRLIDNIIISTGDISLL